MCADQGWAHRDYNVHGQFRRTPRFFSGFGAAAGTGIAAGTKGQEIEIPAGTGMKIKLDEPVQVTLRL